MIIFTRGQIACIISQWIIVAIIFMKNLINQAILLIFKSFAFV